MTTRTILEPRWGDNEKTSIVAKFQYTDEDGARREARAVITNTDESNPDWAEIMSTFTTEEIDNNTQERLDRIAEARKDQEESRLRDKERHLQENLFDLKLQLFENPLIYNSEDMERKKNVRRATSAIHAEFFAIDLLIHDAFKRAGIDLPDANTTWSTT
jgi:hypothetical protein